MQPQFVKFRQTYVYLLLLFSTLVFSQTTIGSYDFESPNDESSWTLFSGSYLNTDSQFSCSGNQSIHTTKSSKIESPAYDLSSYKSVEFSFCYKSYNLSSGEGFDIEFYDGSNWVNVKSYVLGTDFSNTGASYSNYFIFKLHKSIGFSTASKFRIVGDGNNNADKSYFDNILIVEGSDNIDFDGSDDYIHYEDINDLTGSFTIEAWVMQEQMVALGTIVAKRYDRGSETAENARGYQLSIKNGFPQFSWYDHAGNSELIAKSPFAITNNKWYHISVTYNQTVAKIFIDGIEVDSINSTEVLDDNDQNFTIGALFKIPNDPDPKFFFDGAIQEVRIWDVALTEQQIREMMNQPIEENTSASPSPTVKGSVVPLDIAGSLLWENLIGYYPLKDGTGNDFASNPINGVERNMITQQADTAPLPYITTRGGSWDDSVNTTSPWTYVDNWRIPNTTGIDGSTVIDWNIVETSHDVYTNRETKVLGLISTTNELSVLADNSLTISHYLKLDGVIDLDGESQLLQDEGSILDENSTGYLERDQQGTASSYNYNYWASPVSPQGSVTNNATYTIADVLKDGTNPSNPKDINFQAPYTAADNAAPSPIILSSYWMYRFNGPSDNYNSWVHVGSTGALKTGEGFTLKGADGTKEITDTQNYVFKGKPNNGTINLTLGLGNDYLIGNPYPSALDANEFLNDNLKDTPDGTASANIINGALYFWDHFTTKTHFLRGYVGGYGSINKIGGVNAVSTDARINANGKESNKRPGQYIPVTQGFFVVAEDGGTITFKNSQRIFKKEVAEVSTFLKSDQAKNTEKSTENGLKIWLNLDLPSGYHRQLLIGEAEGTTNNFDIGYDAPLIENNADDAYWFFNDEKYVIQGAPKLDNTQTFPIGLKVNKTGLFRVKLDDLMYDYNNTPIYLKDNTTDEIFDIKYGIFETVLEAGEYNDRFSIVFGDQTVLGVNDGFDLQEESINVYINQEESMLTINKSNEITINSIAIYNTLGQQIHSWNSGLDKNTIQLPVNLTKGVYIAKVKTDKSWYSKKLLFRN